MARDYRKNRFRNRDKGINKLFIGSIILVAATIFIMSYVLLGKKTLHQAKVSDLKIRENSNAKVLNVISNDNQTSVVSSSIGKNINEMQNQMITNEEETEKIAINTSKIESKTIEEREEKKNEENGKTSEQIEENVLQTTGFIKPVEGPVIKDFSDNNLVYSNTLDEWTTHLGLDFSAEKTSIVKATASGVVKSIKNDPRYGLTLVLEHDNGYESMYANLLSTEFVEVGEKVEQGQTIATVGNTATFEIAEETHLHFDILKDSKIINQTFDEKIRYEVLIKDIDLKILSQYQYTIISDELIEEK